MTSKNQQRLLERGLRKLLIKSQSGPTLLNVSLDLYVEAERGRSRVPVVRGASSLPLAESHNN